jgi:uncharacterized protein YecE (DUF72 family)
VQPLEQLAEEAEDAYVMFNNNGRSRAPGDSDRWISQAPTNALMLRTALQSQGARV